MPVVLHKAPRVDLLALVDVADYHAQVHAAHDEACV